MKRARAGLRRGALSCALALAGLGLEPAAVLLGAGGGALWARAPETSLRPVARPATADPGRQPPAEAAAPLSEGTPPAQPARAADPTGATSRAGMVPPRPVARPPARPPAREAAGRSGVAATGGGLCGRATLQGEVIGAVPGPGGCGIDGAVRVTGVSGITLSQAVTLDCPSAQALDTWVRDGLKPAVGTTGGGVASLRIMASYACRTRNNQRGARLSEHALGRAVDIGGYRLANGEEVSVLSDWGRGAHGQALRRMHRAACGPFGTVLGPEANRFHRDHFHFDTARHRGGAFCR